MQPLLNSDGSAEYVLSTRDPRDKSCRVICSVNGPLEAKTRDELPQQATLEVVVRPNVGVPAIREALIQDQLYSCLESIILREVMPRSLVQVVVQVLEAGERNSTVNELACSVNAASIALANSAMPLSGLCVGISACLVAQEILTSPSELELDQSRASFMCAFKYEKGPDAEARIVSLQSTGNFTKDELLAVVKQCQDTAQGVYLEMRDFVFNEFKQETKWAN